MVSMILTLMPCLTKLVCDDRCIAAMTWTVVFCLDTFVSMFHRARISFIVNISAVLASNDVNNCE